jgi:ParB/RepB/Spo0J family partition protein
VANASAAAAPHAVVELIPLDKIVPSPTNPRKTFTGIEELAESIKEHGVIEPILVRPVKGIGSNLFMVVFGERRLRASKKAEKEAIPAMVRELSDTDALELQLVENLNRPDIHPLEEAEGFDQLLKSTERSYTVSAIAGKVKKSESYVRESLALLKLCKEGRELFFAGRFSKRGALYVARIPDQGVQREVLEMLEGWHGGKKGEGVYPLRDVTDAVSQQLCRLGDAPFAKDDVELVPGAGPCSTCPKRSGAQPELFADVKDRGELCTDPSCFEKKKDAAWRKRTAEAKTLGLKVLDGKAAEKAMHGSEYVRLDHQNYRDPKYRTWKQLIGKVAKEHVVLAQGDRGEVVELVPSKLTNKLLKQAGHNFKADRSDMPGRSRGLSAKEREESEVRIEVQKRVLAAVGDALWAKEPSRDVWDRVLEIALDLMMGDTNDILARHFSAGDEKKADAAFKKARPELEPKQLRSLALELLLASDVVAVRSPQAKPLLEWADVDPKKLEADVKAERAAAAALLLTWTQAPKKKGTWIGKGAGRVYQVVVDDDGEGYQIRTLKPAPSQTGSWGSASPSGGLEDAKARCEADAGQKTGREPKAITELVGTREDAIAAHEERTKKPAKKGKGAARG